MRISTIIVFTIIIYSTLISQNNSIHTIYTSADGTQSSMLFKNSGELFYLNDNETYRIQKDENGYLNSKLTVSGDFDGDGVQESALFYDYTYIPNGQPKFTGSKIVVYGQCNQSIIPTGIWFSKLKSDLSWNDISFATAGDYNSDGKSDIALFWNSQASENQKIIVLFSNGTSFDEPKELFSTTRDIFNFNALKYIVSGDFSGDNKSDLAVFYDYFGDSPDTNQKIFLFESNGNSFSLLNSVYSATKSTFDFDVCKAALSGDYNGDGKEDIACLINDESNNIQAIEVFENQNKLSFSKKNYLLPDRNDFNFTHVKLAASGLINADNKTDIVLCYDHIGFGSQIMFVYESTGNSFAPFKSYFGAPKLAFSFDNVNALFVGKYDAKPKVMPTIWYNNKPAAVTFGFDDGMANALRYGANELYRNQLNGTFYIISNVPFNNEVDYCNWDTLRYYKNKGHEIGSHTANHKFSGNYSSVDSIIILNNLLQKSKNDLDTQLTQNTLSFSYPFGSFNSQTPTEVAKHFKTARSSQEGYNLPTPFDFHALKSQYVASTTSNESIKSWFETARTYNYHISLMYHNIQNVDFDKTNDEYSFGLNDLSQNIQDAKKADLWIETQGNVYKYTKERNAVKLISYEAFADSLHFVTDDFLDNTEFNQPITLQVEIPESWTQDSVYTNINHNKSATFTANGHKYCFVNAIPTNSKICVSKTKIPNPNILIQVRKDNLYNCFRIDNEHIKIEALTDNQDIVNIKIFNLSGIVLYKKNVLLSPYFKFELPYSQQLKQVVFYDNSNRIVAHKVLF